jgi:hypothetical protein
MPVAKGIEHGRVRTLESVGDGRLKSENLDPEHIRKEV